MKFIVFVYVHRQSPDIAGGVDSALEVRDGSSEDVFASTGAGDQGTVYGYATRETWTRLPGDTVVSMEPLGLRPQRSLGAGGALPAFLDQVLAEDPQKGE